MREILLGFILSFALALAAYIKKSLSISGFIGAILLGVSLYYFGGFYFWILMISFSVSSSFFTKFGESAKKVLDDINEKGGQRDYIQVIANGLLGFIFGFLYFVTHKEMFIIALATSFAASNADTWASELGVLSKMEPVSIINFKKIQKGVSGGVSVFGTISSLTGSLFIALIFGILLLEKNVNIITENAANRVLTVNPARGLAFFSAIFAKIGAIPQHSIPNNESKKTIIFFLLIKINMCMILIFLLLKRICPPIYFYNRKTFNCLFFQCSHILLLINQNLQQECQK
jgi:uncharacterized protein (TIGR00297 family)